MFKVEIQPGLILKHPMFRDKLVLQTLKIVVLEELHVAFYSAEAGLLNYLPVT